MFESVQTSRCAIHSKIYARLDFYIDRVEQIALNCFTSQPFFKRYVDDCFSIVQSHEQATTLLHSLNSVHTNIKYEME